MPFLITDYTFSNVWLLNIVYTKKENKGKHCNKGFIVVRKMNLFIISIAHRRLGNKCVCDFFYLFIFLCNCTTKAPHLIQYMTAVTAIDFIRSARTGQSYIWVVAKDRARLFLKAALW